MYRICRLWVTACIVIGIMLAAAGAGRSEIPRKVNYQGRLTDSATGQPMPGPHNMTFRLYDSADGGTLLWGEGWSTTADSAGVFSVLLGSTNPMDLTFKGPVWLEVEVDGETLTPRRELASVPFAFRASNADSLGGHGPEDFVLAGDMSSITGGMITDGEVTDADIAADAAIDPGKIAGTAWTSDNDGSGSGLDADTVDGLHADAFADTAHDHDERYYRQDELWADGTINLPGNPVDWTKLKGVPAGLADGTDDEGTGDGHSLDAVDGSPVDAVYVDGDGNVGVGTTEPALGKLTVLTPAGTGIYASSLDGVSIFGYSPDGAGVTGASVSGYAGQFVGRVYVSELLGIGTSTPVTELDVVGNANVTDSYMLGGRRVLYAPAWRSLIVGRNACGGRSVAGVTAIGDSAGFSCTDSTNTFVGQASGRFTSNGYGNVFVGDHAGYKNVTGLGNTFIGFEAGKANEHKGGNTYVGWKSGVNSLGGEHNTFMGAEAGSRNTSGSSNTAVGSEAGQLNETGNFNVFVGASAGTYCTNGLYNTYVGSSAGHYNVSGVCNTYLGTATGSISSIGSYNVFIGYEAGLWEAGSHKLYIADGPYNEDVLIYGDFEAGRIGLGTLDPQRQLHIVGDNPRILIEASSVSPEINFKNTDDAGTDVWSIYKHGTTDDLRLYQGVDRVTFESGTGNVGIGTAAPTSRLHVIGDIHCTGKLTSDGGNDPPYVLYDNETRQAIIARVAREVPEEKQDGAVVFWNGDEERLEVYLPRKGEFRDLAGSVVAEVTGSR